MQRKKEINVPNFIYYSYVEMDKMIFVITLEFKISFTSLAGQNVSSSSIVLFFCKNNNNNNFITDC